MKLTEEQLLDEYEDLCHTEEFNFVLTANQQKQKKHLRAHFLKNQEKARAWDRLNSAFRDPVDWRYLEYIAVKEDKKEVQVVRFG